jgi:hypothetical protein
MSIQVATQNQKTAMPTVVGVFNIVIGSLCLLGFLGLLIAAAVVVPLAEDFWFFGAAGMTLVAVPILAIGALSMVGGILALQRRNWGWVLAGTIASTLVSHLFGIAAIVLTALSKNEFNQ